ncbi:hypothetical protein FMEAI12_2280008 [Parafrankia sp. Ea1.12]|nr:hypothetical protein FMEAI12_2280008 [Parafrankia sp. Ea1.12]
MPAIIVASCLDTVRAAARRFPTNGAGESGHRGRNSFRILVPSLSNCVHRDSPRLPGPAPGAAWNIAF